MRVAVMGCGKMAGAIVERWLEVGILQKRDVVAVEADRERAAAVTERLGIPCGVRAGDALAEADLVLLGIKPQQAATVLPRWAGWMRPRQLVLTMLAGTRAETIASQLGGVPTVVRIMPNTPARVGLGCTAVAWPAEAGDSSRDRLLPLLEALGEVVELEEDDIDAFTSIAGSGPAYVYLFLEALQAAAQAQGFAVEAARAMALATVVGAAQLASSDDRPFGQLRADVTSPGGTTEAAIGVLQAGGWSKILRAATARATERAGELAG